MTRVLSTDEAHTALLRLRTVTSSGLAEQLAAVEREGQRLCQPDVWDGREAARFRDELWPSTTRALHQALEALSQLRDYVDRVNQGIMAAGGNR